MISTFASMCSLVLTSKFTDTNKSSINPSNSFSETRNSPLSSITDFVELLCSIPPIRDVAGESQRRPLSNRSCSAEISCIKSGLVLQSEEHMFKRRRTTRAPEPFQGLKSSTSVERSCFDIAFSLLHTDKRCSMASRMASSSSSRMSPENCRRRASMANGKTCANRLETFLSSMTFKFGGWFSHAPAIIPITERMDKPALAKSS